ncbi:hypothetical protein C8R47DRAFT_453666 [Mycena vitilis]|nr:hypothetical protein C8R47DRAFT_453666 [Mycena vitilis]
MSSSPRTSAKNCPSDSYSALPVECHSITDAVSSWPPEISGILRALDAPLPSWCTTGPYNVISPPSPDEYEERTPRLADVFNLALSTVSDIRSLTHIYGPTRSALPFVSTLIQGLVYTCRREAVILKDTPFIRPRNTNPQRGVDGSATLVACHTVDGVRKDHSSPASQLATGASLPSVLPSNIHDQCSSSSFVESKNSDSSGSPSLQSESSESCSSSSSSSVSSIDVPPEAHILPGRGRHLCAVLPFLCVADIDNIVDLMSSVACQRHVWGSTEPAVGFLLSETGVIASLVLSWLDPSAGVVHIVRADDGQGVFDLQDFARMLSFSHFIINLAPRFAAIFECTAVSCEDGQLDWRSDRIHKGSYDLGSWQERVERWVYDVEDRVLGSGKRESLPPNLPSASVKPPGIPRPRRQSDAADHTEASIMSADEPQQGPMTPSATSQKSSQSVSCSNLATIAVTGLDAMEPHILTWMFDRRASSIGRISFPETTEKPDQIEINANIAKYDAMCGFLGIDWNERPHVDAAVTLARDILVKQVVEQQAGSNKPPTLLPVHQEIMSGRLSVLLFATLGAYTLAAKLQTLTLYEADFRHDWDILLYCFYHGSKTGISPSVFLEHTIHLARNTLADQADLTDLTKFSASSEGQITANLDHCRGNLDHCLNAANDASFDQALLEQASAALNQAIVYRRVVQNMSGFRTAVRARSLKEPIDGKCDGLLCVVIDDTHGLKNEEIMRHNKKGCSKPPALLPPDKCTPEPAPSGSKSAPSGSKSALSQSIPGPSSKRGSSGSKYSERLSPSDLAMLQNPFYANKASVKPLETLTLSPSDVEIPSFDGLLLLPHATTEYKKADADEGKPLNQGRMYLVSVVSFYSTLGIDDYSFYCLVTSGKLGAVLMAWKSSKQDRIYVMERNIVTLDISSPIQAFQFATFC